MPGTQDQAGRKTARIVPRKTPPPGGPAAVKLLILDCDGVLTDGRLIYGPGGEVLQQFSVHDGYGVECLRSAGVEVAIVTGKTYSSLVHRARTLGVKRVVQGATDKAAALSDLARQCGLSLDEVAYVGDDIPDVAAMRLAGFSAAPGNARPEAKAAARHVCERQGGDGAVREVAELILRARRAWPPAGAAPK